MTPSAGFWLILCLALHPLTTSTQSKPTDPCDRELSRQARQIIETRLLPEVKRQRFRLPKDCLLDAAQDRYLFQELHKKELAKGHYECGFCGKVFKSEIYIDKHLDHRHPNETSTDATLCMAALCPYIHCEHFFQSQDEDLDGYHHWEPQCNPIKMALLKKRCDNIAHGCFLPQKGAQSPHMYDFFVMRFCHGLTCDEDEQNEVLARLKQRPKFHERSKYNSTTILFVVFVTGFVYMVGCVWYDIAEEDEHVD